MSTTGIISPFTQLSLCCLRNCKFISNIYPSVIVFKNSVFPYLLIPVVIGDQYYPFKTCMSGFFRTQSAFRVKSSSLISVCSLSMFLSFLLTQRISLPKGSLNFSCHSLYFSCFFIPAAQRTILIDCILMVYICLPNSFIL